MIVTAGSDEQAYRPGKEPRRVRHDIRGVSYAVTEWGDAGQPLLMLLHGWGDAGGTFQFLVDQLQQSWFVVAPDWRGFGSSRLRASSYWFPDYLADLDELLAIYAADTAVSLVGHSMGGNIASLYAGVMPERVANLVNVEGFGLQPRDPADAPANYRRWLEQSRRGMRYRSYDVIDELADRILARSPRMSRAAARFAAGLWGHSGADGRFHIRADPAHKLANPVLYRRAEAEACWQQITARVLLVSGSDSDFNVQASSWLADGTATLPLPGASHREIAAAGHMIHFEAPGALASVIEEFLAPQ